MFEGGVKRGRQLLKDFKHDKEFHYETIKSKTLICHFSQNTSVRSAVHPSIKWPKWVRNDQKGYEMAWVRIDHHVVILYPVELGTKWPNWVRNDLGTKWLLLGTKWPKRRYEMTKVGTKWPGYEMTCVRNDWLPAIRFLLLVHVGTFSSNTIQSYNSLPLNGSVSKLATACLKSISNHWVKLINKLCSVDKGT